LIVAFYIKSQIVHGDLTFGAAGFFKRF
jgi:hypothetical protein